MTPDDLQQWKNNVNTHIDYLNCIVDARKSLKKTIEDHLRVCFNWDDIEYNRDFSVITLKWDKENNPIIRAENISELSMDWIIRADYDDSAFRIVVIEIYPWGLKEDTPPE